MLPETVCTCVARGITLDLIIIELCLFLDLKICAKTLTIANSKSLADIHVTISTHIARDNMCMYSKGHHSTFNIF